MDKCQHEHIHKYKDWYRCDACYLSFYHAGKIELMVNESQARIEALEGVLIDWLASHNLIVKGEPEIPEELSAVLDMGLPLARRIIDALQEDK